MEASLPDLKAKVVAEEALEKEEQEAAKVSAQANVESSVVLDWLSDADLSQVRMRLLL